MSWESTVPYYRVINELVRERRGGLHSARIALHSFDFAEVAALQKAEDWDALTRMMSDAAKALKAAGAEGFAICTNTHAQVCGRDRSASRYSLIAYCRCGRRSHPRNGGAHSGAAGNEVHHGRGLL